MRLIDVIHESDGMYKHEELNLERLYESLGISGKASKEFNTHNLADFNEICENSPTVDYYSIGAKKNGKVMSTLLRNGFDILVGLDWGEQCDGLVRDEEARWGRYLLTYENDHMEVMGFEPYHNPANVFNVVADNIRVCELKNDPVLKYEYGLD